MADSITGPQPEDERLARVTRAMVDYVTGAADALGDPVLAASLAIQIGAAGISVAQDRNKAAAALIAEAMAVLETEWEDVDARQKIIDQLAGRVPKPRA
jgi:NAD(P)H-hydrate repair Nnr-like enzyme with NAD(P)H-hydrate dehydratase domain